MGSGMWSASTYRDRARYRSSAGHDTFEYSRRAKSSGRLEVHPTLNPYGLTVRESRDSDEHPNSNAILIGLDVTGSMSRVVRAIHADLPQLHELLLGHDYIPDPQILFAAVGDATCDRVPLQVGQFESDNRMDDNLENMILEGGGGGYGMESYELLLHVAGRHTSLDCWEKRHRKGYLFMIGDEMAYPFVHARPVNDLIGSGLQKDVPLPDVIAAAREKYNVYFVIPVGASGGENPDIYDFWKTHLGEQHVIRLENPEDISETIALTIGLREGTVGLKAGLDHMRKTGSSKSTVKAVGRALAHIPEADPLVHAGLALADGLSEGSPEGTRRL